VLAAAACATIAETAAAAAGHSARTGRTADLLVDQSCFQAVSSNSFQPGDKEAAMHRRRFSLRGPWLAVSAGLAILSLSCVGTAFAGSDGRAPLTIVTIGNGSVVSMPAGISCPGECTATFATGTRVSLTPKPKSGFKLGRWAGGCAGSGTCSVKVTKPLAVTAQFVAAPKAVAATSAEAGYYGGAAGGYGLQLFVTPGGKAIQNASISSVTLTCVPAVSGAPNYDTQFAIPKGAIRPNGTFSGKATESGTFGTYPATITYSMNGRFTPASASGAASGTGTAREDVVFKDPAVHRCTSNNLSFTLSKNGSVPQPSSLVRPGALRGTAGGYGLALSVTGRTVSGVSLSSVTLTCVPAVSGAPGYDTQFAIPSAAIKADGSFSGKASQSGTFGSSAATITYSISGNFQGPDSSGRQTAAGTVREVVKVGGSTCSSNNLRFTAAG
jgi:hypothetical protein